MVTRSEVFPTKWLKPGDLNGQPAVLQIERATWEPVKFAGKEEKKLTLHFVGTGKSLTLNATNFDSCVEITGEADSDDWSGHVVEAYPTTTEVRGETFPAIRLRKPEQADMLAAAKPKLPPAPAPTPRSDMDDEIPFALAFFVVGAVAWLVAGGSTLIA
jgi:hypothetical protein